MFQAFGNEEALATYIDLSSTSLSCCGVGFNKTGHTYTSFNYSAPRFPKGYGLSSKIMTPVNGFLGLKANGLRQGHADLLRHWM